MNILFVCSGNVSRSFLAEMLLREEILQRGIENHFVRSAGLLSYPDSPPDPRMVEFLVEQEIPVGEHSARQIAKKDVDWADLILVMQREHAEMIRQEWPEAEERLGLLGKYLTPAGTEEDIADPYGGSSYHYRVVQSQIVMAVRSLAERLLSGDQNQVYGD